MEASDRRHRDQLGAKEARSGGVFFRIHIYLQRHLYAFFASLGQLWRSPVATLMTTITMAVTLALPAGLYLMVQSADELTADWHGVPQISLYVEPNASPEKISALVKQLETHVAVEIQSQVSPAEGMKSLNQQLGLEGMLDILGENPLPHVVVVNVQGEYQQTTKLKALVEELSQLSSVDIAKLDSEWLEKLNAILVAFERGVVLIAALLALAVLTTIGNTIRLSIQNRLEEIEVMKLVGAKDAFIRRPFLYGGIWLGLLSGAFALAILVVSYLVLYEPIAYVMNLYNDVFQLSYLVIAYVAGGLLLGSVVLGWLGAWIAVGRQLHKIEP